MTATQRISEDDDRTYRLPDGRLAKKLLKFTNGELLMQVIDEPAVEKSTPEPESKPPTHEQLVALTKATNRVTEQHEAAGLYDTPYEKLEKGLASFCKTNAIPESQAWSRGLPAFQKTAEGAALYKSYSESSEPLYHEPREPLPMPVAKSAYDAFADGLAAFCAERKITKQWTDGLEAYRATDEGARLEAAYREEG